MPMVRKAMAPMAMTTAWGPAPSRLRTHAEAKKATASKA